MKILDIIILSVYMILLVIYGLWKNYKTNDLHEFAVANKQYKSFTVFLTIAATFIGGGFTIGNAGYTYAYGIVIVLSFLGVSGKEILIARFVAPHLDKFPDAISIGDVVYKNYGNIGKVVTGLCGFIVSIGIVAGQIAALSQLFEEFFDISGLLSIVIGVSIVTIYSALGGIIAVVRTDKIQFFILFIGILSIVYFGITKAGGIGAVYENIPKEKFNLLGDKTLLSFIALFIFWMIGETLTPAYFSRLLIAKDNKQIVRAAYSVGFFSIIFIFIPAFLGLLGYSFDLKVADNPDVVLPQIINLVLPWWWKPIVLAAILSVIMSSSDSFLNSGAITFVHDVLKPVFSEKRIKNELNLIKIMTITGGVLTILFTLSGGTVISIIGQSYMFWAPVVLIPLLFSVMEVKSSLNTFITGSLLSIVSTLSIFIFTELGAFNSVVIGFFTCLISYLVMDFLLKKIKT